jgi:hypothetical protein
VAASASFRQDDYPEDQEGLAVGAETEAPEEGEEDTETETVVERTDDLFGAEIGLTYSPLTWASCNLNYRYRNLESDDPEDEYEENRVTFYITLTTPRPWQRAY